MAGPGALALSLALAAAAAPSAPGKGWHDASLPHFTVHFESALAPRGFALSLERIHSRLALELSALAPWMAKEKTEVWVYSSRESYRRGEFRPPAWSNGLSLVEERKVAVFEQDDAEELERTLAHELTHVYFDSYFQLKDRKPPVWLTEGLAMLMETPQVFSGSGESKSPWHRMLFEGPGLKVRPMAEFFGQETDGHASSQTVDQWYLQAYAGVRFLLREHTRLQFRIFCEKLRDSQDLEGTLWAVYRFRDLDAFQKAFLGWLGKSAKPQTPSPSQERPARLEFNHFKDRPGSLRNP